MSLKRRQIYLIKYQKTNLKIAISIFHLFKIILEKCSIKVLEINKA